jgi:hypothetical protein
VEVRGRAPAEVVSPEAVERAKRLGDARDMRRLVPGAAMRHRCEKRAVGLRQEAIHRDGTHGFA